MSFGAKTLARANCLFRFWCVALLTGLLSLAASRGEADAPKRNRDHQRAERRDEMDLAIAANHRGMVLFENRRYTEALTAFGRAIRLAPKEPTFCANRAVAWLMKGNMREALQDCTKAIRVSPRMAELYL